MGSNASGTHRHSAPVLALRVERRGEENPTSQVTACLTEAAEVLAATTGMRQWTVNRKVDDAFVVLSASACDGGLAVGDRLPWSHTLCSLMTAGTGPTVAGSLRGTVYEYAVSDTCRSYVGVALTTLEGDLLGSVSGTDDRERTDLLKHEPLARMLATQLSGLLVQQAHSDQLERALTLARDDADTDVLTGLANRRGWERLLEAEQVRNDRLASQSGVVIIDVDGLKPHNDRYGHAAGDALLQATARALRAVLRQHDIAARVGGDEFAILLGDVTQAELDGVVVRMRSALRAAGVNASVGSAVTGASTVRETVAVADARMYAQKATRRHRLVHLSSVEDAPHGTR